MCSITRNRALEIASQQLEVLKKETGEELTLLVEETIEKEFGWVFFYNSRKFVETGSFQHMLAGNAPFVVDALDGSVVFADTANPIDEFIQEYSDKRRQKI